MDNERKAAERKRIGNLALSARKEQGWSMAFLLSRLKAASSLFKTWDTAKISRIEHGQAGLATEEAPIYASVLGKPAIYFLGNASATTNQSPPLHCDLKEPTAGLPNSIPLLIRELQVRVDKLEFWEVPVVEVSTLPNDFFLQQPTGCIRVSRADLAGVGDESYKNLFALRLSSGIAEGFGIRQGDFVVLDHKPEEINGRLYMAFYHDLIVVRRMYWVDGKVRMEDADGKSVTVNRDELSMSGSIILSGSWQRHWE